MKNLKLLRQQKNLSQARLAEMFHITQQSIWKYENGLSQPDLNLLIQFADYFDTSIDYLVGYTDNPRKNEYLIKEELNAEEYKYLSQLRNVSPELREVLSTLCDLFLERKK